MIEEKQLQKEAEQKKQAALLSNSPTSLVRRKTLRANSNSPTKLAETPDGLSKSINLGARRGTQLIPFTSLLRPTNKFGSPKDDPKIQVAKTPVP